MGRYSQGETVPLRCDCYNISHELVDPSSIEISIEDPNSALKVDDAAMTKEEVGKYYYHYLLANDAAVGMWLVQVKVTNGAGFVQISDDSFEVFTKVI